MKKLLASILLLVYFAVSTGFVISVHYCMNKLDAVQLGHNDDEVCGNCGMTVTEGGGCCTNEVKVVKLQLDQLFAKFASPNLALAAVANPVSAFFLSAPMPIIAEAFPLSHGPPLAEDDTYLRNRVFRL